MSSGISIPPVLYEEDMTVSNPVLVTFANSGMRINGITSIIFTERWWWSRNRSIKDDWLNHLNPHFQAFLSLILQWHLLQKSAIFQK